MFFWLNNLQLYILEILQQFRYMKRNPLLDIEDVYTDPPEPSRENRV